MSLRGVLHRTIRRGLRSTHQSSVSSDRTSSKDGSSKMAKDKLIAYFQDYQKRIHPKLEDIEEESLLLTEETLTSSRESRELQLLKAVTSSGDQLTRSELLQDLLNWQDRVETEMRRIDNLLADLTSYTAAAQEYERSAAAMAALPEDLFPILQGN